LCNTAFYNITFNLSLEQIDIFTETAVLSYIDPSNITHNLNLTAESHSYAGIVVGDDNSEACLTIDDNITFLYGFVNVENSTDNKMRKWYYIENNLPDENGNITEENKSHRTYMIDLLNHKLSWSREIKIRPSYI